MIAYTVLVSFGMRTVSFLERLFSPGIGSYAANLTEVKTRMPNAKVLSEKQAIVASLTEKLQGAAAGIIVDYKGITVAEDTALRAECRKNEVDYAVVKNTLLLAVASDPVAPARVIADYAKKLNGKFEIKGVFMDGKVVDMATINALAAIPALPVLQAQVLGTMLAPITSLACVLKQIAEKDGAPAEAAEAAAE